MIKTSRNNIYVVMYHYVRDIKKSKYPNLKALDVRHFERQISYFKKNFNVLDQDSFTEILNTKKFPKKKSLLLTFDDGYIDHYEYVFPLLKKNNLSGIFYPPVKVIGNNKVLDVNKIHFVLEKEQNTEKILKKINLLIKKFYSKNLSDIDLSKINLKSRYDDRTTKLIKLLLQNILPKKIRTKILNHIFEDVMGVEEKIFAKKLYLTREQIHEMMKNNMFFGLHGYNHIRLEHLTKNKQCYEIENSINFFEKNGVPKNNISFCYPYGSYNKQTLSLMKKNKFKFALTTKVGSLNNNNISNIYEIPRYDANDFKIN